MNYDTKIALADLSPSDKSWDKHKAESVQVSKIYLGVDKHAKKAVRIHFCSEVLDFGVTSNLETGEVKLHLANAHFCRVRLCPICQWRRVLLWRSRLYQVLPFILVQHPTAKFLFLTLTVKNCRIEELRATLKNMNKAWHRLLQCKEFSSVVGWIRTTEVTKEKEREGYAHPHFHCLLMVNSNYFTKNYIPQEQWTRAWQKSLRIDYIPQVDIRKVRAKKKSKKSDKLLPQNAIMETLKYAVKFKDVTDCPDWFLTLTEEINHLRFIASGGVFKDVFKKERKITEEDMIKLGKQSRFEEFEEILRFFWQDKHYIFDKSYPLKTGTLIKIS